MACSSAPFPSPGRGRVLYVDDDPVARMVFAGWLERHGYAHEIASGPPEANGFLACATFDVVLSDIHMPGNSRLEWVEQILNAPGTPPVLLLTGTPEFETACRAANLAVAGYLLKPADFTTLDATLQQIIGRRCRHAEFQAVARDIVDLLRQCSGPGSDADHRRLALLVHALDACLDKPAGNSPAGDESWRAAVADAIAVLEQTRHHFRSRELGQLRARLHHLLTGARAPLLH